MIKFTLDEEHLDDCIYGQPYGPDEFTTACDCFEDLETIKRYTEEI